MDGAIVADIFAGSGALGLEAISRGAAFCLFVETEPKARAAIRANTEAFGLGGMTRLHRRDEEVDLSGFDIHVDRTWGAARVVFMTVKN